MTTDHERSEQELADGLRALAEAHPATMDRLRDSIRDLPLQSGANPSPRLRHVTRPFAIVALVLATVIIALPIVAVGIRIRNQVPPSAYLPVVAPGGSAAATVLATAQTDINGIAGLTGTTAWVLAGTDMSVSSDGGRSWSRVTLPAGGDATTLRSGTTLTAVAAVGDRAVWLATSEGSGCRVFRWSTGDSSWTSTLLIPSWSTSSGVSSPPDSIRVSPGPGTLLTVYESVSTGMSGAVTSLFVSTDGGITFTQHSPASGPARQPWRSLFFADQKSAVLAVGADTSDTTRLLRTADGGDSWSDPTILGVPTTAYRAYGLPRLDDSQIVVPVTTWTDAAGGGGSEIRLLVSSDRGATFSAIGQSAPIEGTVSPVSGGLGSATWVIPPDGRSILETSDMGTTWSTVLPQGLPAGILRVELTGPTSALVLAAQSGCNGVKSDCWTHAHILRTEDAGRTWTSAWTGE